MDHIPVSSASAPIKVTVPYLAKGIHRRQYESSSFEISDSYAQILSQILERVTEASLALLDDIRNHRVNNPNTEDIRLATIQSWLYFDLLRHAFGSSFCDQDFIRCTTDDRLIITSEKLPLYMDSWVQQMSTLAKARVEFQVTKIVSAIKMAWSACNWIDAEEWPEDSRHALVLFSIRVLITSLGDMIQDYNSETNAVKTCFTFSNERVSWPHLPHSYLPLGALMAQKGWCPQDIVRVMRMHNCCTVWYLMRLPHHASLCETHRLCDTSESPFWQTLAHDMALSAVKLDYLPKHTTPGCCCDAIGPNMNEVSAVLQDGGIPLIKCTITDRDNITFRVCRAGRGKPYIAISHVWAHGLGVPKRNQVFRCQLISLLSYCHRTKGNLRVNQGIGWSRLSAALSRANANRKLPIDLWIDLFCIPATPVHNLSSLKAKAISLINPTFAGADAVILVDKSLRRTDPKNMPLTEIAARAAISGWMSRCWTFLEVSLARDVPVYFCFESQLVEMDSFISRSPPKSISDRYSRAIYKDLTSSFLPLRIFGVEAGSRKSPGWQYVVFLLMWNALADRTTSRTGDMWGILAILLGYSGSEIMSLAESTRLQALLRDSPQLPISFFTKRLLRRWDLEAAHLHWIPGSIDHLIAATEATLPFRNDGVTIPSSMGLKLSWEATGPLAKEFILEYQDTCFEIYVHLSPIPSGYQGSASSRRSQDEDLTQFCVFLAAGRKGNEYLDEGKVVCGSGTCLSVIGHQPDGIIEADFVSSLSYNMIPKGTSRMEKRDSIRKFGAEKVTCNILMPCDRASWYQSKFRRQDYLIYVGRYGYIAYFSLPSIFVVVCGSVLFPILFKWPPADVRFVLCGIMLAIAPLPIFLGILGIFIHNQMFRNWVESFQDKDPPRRWWKRVVAG